MTWTSLRNAGRADEEDGHKGRSEIFRSDGPARSNRRENGGCSEFFAVVDGRGKIDPGEGWQLRLRRRTGWSPLDMVTAAQATNAEDI